MTFKKVPPLQWVVPIVTKDGRPTPEFIRWWQDVFKNVQNTKNTTDEISGDLTTTNDTVEELDANKVDKTTQVIAGVGLDGGGALSADVTLDANIQDLLNSIGATRGSILYRGASGWAILAPGTAGTKLTSNGAGADPTWT